MQKQQYISTIRLLNPKDILRFPPEILKNHLMINNSYVANIISNLNHSGIICDVKVPYKYLPWSYVVNAKVQNKSKILFYENVRFWKQIFDYFSCRWQNEWIPPTSTSEDIKKLNIRRLEEKSWTNRRKKKSIDFFQKRTEPQIYW